MEESYDMDDEKKEIKNLQAYYNKIPFILKRFSFSNKMDNCKLHSLKLTIEGNLQKTLEKGAISPWTLEIFALFSVLNQEYENHDNRILNEGIFKQIIYTIDNYAHPKLLANDNEFVNRIMMILAIQQFKHQHSKINKLCRYNFIFTYINEKINMQTEFNKKFQTSYNDFLYLGFFILTYLKNNFIDNAAIYLLEKYSKVTDNLILDRSEFIKQQLKYLPNDIESYQYSFKCFYSYPFIRYKDNIYMPLPHLLVDSITESLFYRLTEENDNLRSLIGKEILEKYLYLILKNQIYIIKY